MERVLIIIKKNIFHQNNKANILIRPRGLGAIGGGGFAVCSKIRACVTFCYQHAENVLVVLSIFSTFHVRKKKKNSMFVPKIFHRPHVFFFFLIFSPLKFFIFFQIEKKIVLSNEVNL